MVSLHLSKEHLSQLSCKEECGSIPAPELFLCSWPAASSSLSGLHGGPSACHTSETSALLPLPANPTQAAGRDLWCLCYMPNACSLFDHIHIKCQGKDAFFILLLTLTSVTVPLQPSSSPSFFFSIFFTLTDNKTTCSLS